MDQRFKVAAAEGNIEPFKGITKEDLRSLVTLSKSTVLHVYIIESPLQNYRERESVTTKFVEGILNMCPSLLGQVDANGDAPLHVAVKYGNLDVVSSLIKFAKEPRQMLEMKNREKNTALHEAVQNGRVDIAKQLIKADPYIPYSTNDGSETPLYMAVARGLSEMVAVILDNCPSAAHKGPNGKNALHAAVTCWNAKELIRLLLEKKKSLSRETDQDGWTPLHHAAYLDCSDLLPMLLNSDKSIAFIPDCRKMTALHLAAGQGNLTTIEILRLCPECYNLIDVRGWNVLHYAMISFPLIELKKLLEAFPILTNLLLNDKDVNGNTPLHVLAAFCRYSSYKVVPRKDKGDYHAVNNRNISVADLIWSRDIKLEREIRELSKGQGQYTNGVVRMRIAEELQDSIWKYIGDEVIGVKDAKDSHLVVAALIATVTFAAAFTVPGGFHEDGPNEGTAILGRNTAFKAFVISNAIATVLSLSSVLVHFILSLKAFGDMVFLFVFALFSTIIAIIAMVVAFVSGAYAVLSPSLGLAFACFVSLYFFLLVFIMFWNAISKASQLPKDYSSVDNIGRVSGERALIFDSRYEL